MLLRDLFENIGLNDRGGNAVHQHASRGQFFAEGFGQRDHSGFGGAVMRSVRIAFFASNGGDVHDAAILALDHVRHDRAAAKKDAEQIRLDDFHPFAWVHLPGFFGDPGNAGVVDQNVNRAQRFQGRL